MPTAAQKALIGVTDGTYRVTFDPQKDQVFPLGPNRLEIPANAVCTLGTSGYGAAFWDAPCTPQTAPVQLTVTVRNAASDNPSVDFQPAMRFNPQTVRFALLLRPQRQPDGREELDHHLLPEHRLGLEQRFGLEQRPERERWHGLEQWLDLGAVRERGPDGS